MDALECLKTRRSVRQFQNEPVDGSTIEDIILCGSRASTAMNLQPWFFVAVTEADTKKKIADITDHGKFIYEAPCCIAVFCEKVKYYLEDGSAATQNMLLAAHAHGLASCWIAGDKKPYCSDIADMLGVPENYTLVSLIAIGKPKCVPSPQKKEIHDIMRWERYS